MQLNSVGCYPKGSLELNLSLVRLGLQETEEKIPLFWSRIFVLPLTHVISSKYNVFKIHSLMVALALTRNILLLFHSVKGALFIISLIISGWAFVNCILSNKEEIFGIRILIQVLADLAHIVIKPYEEGVSDYGVLFLGDLICCDTILLLVVWSIQHLAPRKVAVNLAKLKLFWHYYVMCPLQIICCIYFMRSIAILLWVAMPFQWQWLYQVSSAAGRQQPLQV